MSADRKPDSAPPATRAADSRMYAGNGKAAADAELFDGVMAAQLLPLQYDVLRLRADGEHRASSALLTGVAFYALSHNDLRIGRSVLEGKLGGGDAGFDGILRTDFGNGLCLPGIARCFFGRTLLNFELRGNQRYFSRLFRLGGELGYFYTSRNLVLDFGINAGLPLFGVTKVAGTRVQSRVGVSPGASALVAYSYGPGDLRLSADAVRHEAGGGSVDRLNVALCGGGNHFSLCTSFDYFALEAPSERDAIVTSIAFAFAGGGGVTEGARAPALEQ